GSWIKKTTRAQCLRLPYLTPEKHGDAYYYGLLLLYQPWRNETDLVKPEETAEDNFIQNFDPILQQQKSVSSNQQFSNAVQRALIRRDELVNNNVDFLNYDELDERLVSEMYEDMPVCNASA